MLGDVGRIPFVSEQNCRVILALNLMGTKVNTAVTIGDKYCYGAPLSSSSPMCRADLVSPLPESLELYIVQASVTLRGRPKVMS